jgi:hypothetical protein
MWTARRLTVGLAVAALAAPAVLGLSAGMASGGAPTDTVTPQSNTSLTFVITRTAPCPDATEPTVTVTHEPDGTTITPTSFTPTSDTTFTVVLPPSTPPGELAFTLKCPGIPADVAVDVDFATVTVVKAVVGPAPSTATFQVQVACDVESAGSTSSSFANSPTVKAAALSNVAALSYPATGGTENSFFLGPGTCTITEPVTGGAVSTTIVPPTVTTSAPALFTSTVTNSFPLVVEPSFTG